VTLRVLLLRENLWKLSRDLHGGFRALYRKSMDEASCEDCLTYNLPYSTQAYLLDCLVYRMERADARKSSSEYLLR
jgi:hypothetical protein